MPTKILSNSFASGCRFREAWLVLAPNNVGFKHPQGSLFIPIQKVPWVYPFLRTPRSRALNPHTFVARMLMATYEWSVTCWGTRLTWTHWVNGDVHHHDAMIHLALCVSIRELIRTYYRNKTDGARLDMLTIANPDARAATPWNNPSIRRVPTGSESVTDKPSSSSYNSESFRPQPFRITYPTPWTRTVRYHFGIIHWIN